MNIGSTNTNYVTKFENNQTDYSSSVATNNQQNIEKDPSDEVKLTPITQLKKAIFPAITESMELGRDLGENIAKINDYEVIKKAGLVVGLSEKKAHIVAVGFSNREFNRYITKTSIKLAEYIPSKYIESKLTKEINNQVINSISKNIPNITTVTDPKISAAFKASITEGNLKAVETLKSKDLLSKSVDLRGEVKGIIANVKDEGIKSTAKDIKNTFLTKSDKGVIKSAIENTSEHSKHLLKKTIDNATEKATEKISEKGFTNISNNSQKILFRKNVAKATETAINKTVSLTSVKIATGFTKVMPVLSTVAEGFVMYNDIEHTRKLFNDKDASNLSKALSVSTVALDAVSLHSVLTGSFKRGLYASGFSILTSVGSSLAR